MFFMKRLLKGSCAIWHKKKEAFLLFRKLQKRNSGFLNNKICNKIAQRKLVAVFMSIVILTLSTGAVLDFETKMVTLVMVDAFNDNEETQELTTRQDIVSDFLKENDIEIGEYDKLSMLPEDKLYGGARLIIRKGRKFTLNIDGNIEIITTTKKTVREAFEEAGVLVNQTDRVEPGLDELVTDDMTVNVYRVQYQEITVDTEIPFTSKEVADGTLEKGKTKVKVQGVNGLLRTTYSVTTENGVEVNREVISETRVKEPINQVVAVGTKQKAVAVASKSASKAAATKKAVTANTGESLNYSKKITVSATAYTAAAGSKTASGRVAQYGVVAVDPNVIPLGTKLYIESTDDGKTWKYGYCIAGDTGGAIKGNKIDLYYNSKSECLQFGRRSAIVYVLN